MPGPRARRDGGRPRRIAAGITPFLFVAAVLTACGGTEPPSDEQPAPVTEVRRLASTVPGPVARDGVLTIGTDPSYPPMEFVGGDGAAVEGADIDLARGVATVLGLRPEFVDEAFSALTDSVRTGRIELAAASLTVPRREPLGSDAVLYFRSGNQLVAADSAPHLAVDGLCGRTIATVEGSTQVRSLARLSRDCRELGAAGITIEALSDQEQVTGAALTDRVDGMLSDIPVAQLAVRQHPRQLSPAGPPFDRAPFGMLSAPHLRQFTVAVRRAVQRLIDIGYYGSVLRKWGIADGAVRRATIRWSARSVASRHRAAHRAGDAQSGTAANQRARR